MPAEIGECERGIAAMDEEAFAVHVLMTTFLNPRPTQSGVSGEGRLERRRSSLKVGEGIRLRIDVVGRRAVDPAADWMPACVATVCRNTSRGYTPAPIAKRYEAGDIG